MTDYNLLKAFLCLLCLRGYDYTFPRSPTPYEIYSVITYNSTTDEFRCAEAEPLWLGRNPIWVNPHTLEVYNHLRDFDRREVDMETLYVLLHKPMKGEKIE